MSEYGKRKWINFARYTSRDYCIGKGRILNAYLDAPRLDGGSDGLFIDMTLDGVRYTGTLSMYGEEEE